MVTTSDISDRDDLKLLRAFVNTLDVEEGEDALGDASSSRAWMSERGIDRRVTDADAARVREFREALRLVLLSNNGGDPDPAALAILAAAAGQAPLRVGFDPDGSARLEPAGHGVDALIGTILATIQRTHAEGLWPRLKACAADDCQWAFFDSSRNRSRTWCDMAVCGNRAKARSYRARGG